MHDASRTDVSHKVCNLHRICSIFVTVEFPHDWISRTPRELHRQKLGLVFDKLSYSRKMSNGSHCSCNTQIFAFFWQWFKVCQESSASEFWSNDSKALALKLHHIRHSVQTYNIKIQKKWSKIKTYNIMYIYITCFSCPMPTQHRIHEIPVPCMTKVSCNGPRIRMGHEAPSCFQNKFPATPQP